MISKVIKRVFKNMYLSTNTYIYEVNKPLNALNKILILFFFRSIKYLSEI